MQRSLSISVGLATGGKVSGGGNNIVRTWLDAITALTETQRRRAFEALALAEAGVAAELCRQEVGAPGRTGPARSGFNAAAATPTVSDLGQQKVALTGCPHCGQTEIVRWGTSSGLPRYRCKACTRTFRIAAHVLPRSGKPDSNAPDFHPNNVNAYHGAYHGRLKERLRRFHGVATKNLPNSLGWRRALEALGNTASLLPSSSGP